MRLPPTPPPIPPSSTLSSSAPETNLSSSAATANIRVLVRIRPHNHTELTERGPIGRANVLTSDNQKRSKHGIDFNNSSANNNDDPFSSNATIAVKGGDEYDGSNGTGINGINGISGGLPPISRRITGNNIGYSSDGDVNNNTSYSKQFTFDAVHGPRSTQCEVYESVKGIIDAVTQGYNGTIVAYGQTGSGKTHTIFGDESSMGLVQRSLRDMFQKITLAHAEESVNNDNTKSGAAIHSDGSNELGNSIPSTNSSKATFHGSFFEIFNERVYDLLATDKAILDNSSLAVREDHASGVYVEGLKEVQVANSVEAEALLAKGLLNRQTASTKMNRTSSRSHAVFVLSVKSEYETPDGLKRTRNSKFTLVDLAGSERQKSTAAYGNRLKEASMINKSLLCLGHVINALVDKEAGKARHVPFRDSKLTFLLRDTWGGNSKTCLVATVSPSGLSLSETVSTLKFAQRAKLIKNNAILNEDTCGTVAALQAEVAKLRSELEKNDTQSTKKPTRNRHVYLGDTDMVAATKRRAERAERKLANLEKQMSEEREVKQTLKRKLQDETMVRKFKERRISYLQTKSTIDGLEDNEQVRLLREEISSLQKRLDTPSPEAVEWRVAYEEAKDKLEKVNDQGENEIINNKIEELEDVIERLCNEKLTLEERVSEMKLSTDGTRSEIDSMIHEVERLEKDMNAVQNDLDTERKRSHKFESRANEANSILENMTAQMGQNNIDKTNLEFEMNVMKTKFSALESQIGELSSTLKQKHSELIEMEILSRENELELQCTIGELENQVAEAKKDATVHMESELQIQGQLKESKTLNEQINKDLLDAQKQVKDQQAAITTLEEKIDLLSSDKDTYSSTVKKYEESEVELKGRIESMSTELDQLQQERGNLEQRLSCVREQSGLVSTDLDEKTKVIHSLQDQIISLKDNYAENIRSSKEQNQLLERKLSDFTKTQDQVLSLKSALELKENSLNETEKQSKGLMEKLSASQEENDELKRNLNEAKDSYEKTQLQLDHAEKSLAQNVSNLQLLSEENNSMNNETIKNYEESHAKLGGKIKLLENEQSQNLLIIEELRKNLGEKKTDFNNLTKELKTNENKISQFQGENELLKEKTNTQLIELESQLHQMKEQLSTTIAAKDELESDFKSIIVEKDNQITKLEKERKTVCSSLEDSESSFTVLRKTHDIEIQKLMYEKGEFEKQSADYEKQLQNSSKLQEEIQETVKELEKRVQDSGDSSNYKIQEMQKELSEKDSFMSKIHQEYESLIQAKDVELAEMEKGAIVLKADHSQLMKKYNVLMNSEDEIREKLRTQRDRVILMQREKGQLNSEIDVLRQDQDALNDKIRSLSKENQALLLESDNLRHENKTLRADAENQSNDSVSRTSTFENDTNISYYNQSNDSVSRSSTFENDTTISYDNLSSGMDSMLGKMSTNKTVEEESVCNPADESLDESMFLPNANLGANVAYDEKENISDDVNNDIVISTPLKSDYGRKRQPLSERKQNRTPLSVRPMNKLKSTAKKMRSSTKKLRSVSKLNGSQYMMFNNKQLFGEK